ncbi:hypothetical protein M422DRAFT_37258, partial [Sphaerobolus stellatus SS14]
PLLTLSPTIPFQYQPLLPHHQRIQTLHVSSTSNHLVDVGPCEAEWVRVVEMIDAPYVCGRTLKLSPQLPQTRCVFCLSSVHV